MTLQHSAPRPMPRTVLWCVIAIGALVPVAIASVAFGVRVVSWDDIVRGLTGDAASIGQIAVRERLPRTVLAFVVGAALSLGGTTLQGVTRNPLADPAILGISSGGALAVVIGMTFFGLSAPSAYIWVAIGGCGAAALTVWTIGSWGRGGPTPMKLALAGAATWAATSSLISALLLPRIEVMDRYRYWQIGGVGGAEWPKIVQVAPFLVVGVVLCLGAAKGLNALALGDDVAVGLGQHVTRTRLLAGLGAVVLCGAATAVAGPIAFVGLIGPHLSRLLIGVDHRWLLPFSALTGAALLAVSDVIGRIAARPSEVDVGIVTAFVGAPVFIWVVRRQKAGAL